MSLLQQAALMKLAISTYFPFDSFDIFNVTETDSCRIFLHVTFCQVIRDAFAVKKDVLTKANFADLVTETDRNVEEMIIGHLQKKFPTHRCLIRTVNSDTIKSNK